MKKSVIIIIVCLLVVCLSVGITFGIIKCNSNKKISNDIVTTITMDINPSIEINLDKDNKVISVKALNSDSKKIISNKNFKGKNLENTINTLVDSLKENGYLNDEKNMILINVESKDEVLNNVEEVVNKVVEEKKIKCDVVVQQIEVTKELETLARKYDMTPSKAYYIREQIKDNENLQLEDFKNISLEEIVEKVNNTSSDKETKVEEKIVEEKKESNNTKPNTNNNSSSKSSYTCTPPSDIKSTEWCNWNVKRPQNCEYSYPGKLNSQDARKYIDSSEGLVISNYGTTSAYSGASYCYAYMAIITTESYRHTIYLDSVTGEFLTEKKESIPQLSMTKDQALAQGLEHFGLNEEDCKNCWVVFGTNGEGGPNWYYRYQVNMDMSDGYLYSIDYNAVTGKLVGERHYKNG